MTEKVKIIQKVSLASAKTFLGVLGVDLKTSIYDRIVLLIVIVINMVSRDFGKIYPDGS